MSSTGTPSYGANTYAPVTLQQPRYPAVYHGDVFEDVEDWLEQFERVASFEHCDTRQKMRNVYFVLDDGASTGFENREASLSI